MGRTDERVAIEQLAQLLDGELPADEADTRIRGLATLGTVIGDTTTVERPQPAFRAALREQLIAHVETAPITVLDRARDAVWHRTARWRHSTRVGAATAAASVLLATAGVATAALQAMPGEPLYEVKRTTEALRVTVAGDIADQARVHLSLAEERRAEARDGLDLLTADQLEGLFEAMDEATRSAAEALFTAVGDGADAALLGELADFVERQCTGLASLSERLPIDARPLVTASMDLLRELGSRAGMPVAACAAPWDRDDPSTDDPGDTTSRR